MSQKNLCPCGSSLDLSACCLPIIRETRKAASAEELLRARYTAFTQGEIDFIFSSHHSKTQDQVSRDEIEDWSKNSKWLGLKVLQVEDVKKDADSAVIFFAAYYETSDQKKHEHVEKSLFKKEKGEWKFFDSERTTLGTYRRTEPKIGRNDPCSCGSGKKYKKCHALIS
jgi:SEC-C motif-containing protein